MSAISGTSVISLLDHLFSIKQPFPPEVLTAKNPSRNLKSPEEISDKTTQKSASEPEESNKAENSGFSKLSCKNTSYKLSDYWDSIIKAENREIEKKKISSKTIKPELTEFRKIAAEIGREIGADGVEKPLNESQVSLLAKTMSGYDIDTLDNLVKSGLKIRICDSEKTPDGGYPGREPDWSWGECIGGYYNPYNKLICLKKSGFEDGNNYKDVINHEFGHALDDMLEPDEVNKLKHNMKTRKDERMKKICEVFNKTLMEQGKSKIISTETSIFSPQEYFAECVAFYLGGNDKRNELKEKDPAMFNYVKDMLEKSEDKTLPSKQVKKEVVDENPSGFKLDSNSQLPLTPEKIDKISSIGEKEEILSIVIFLMFQRMMSIYFAMSICGSPFMGR